MQCKTFRLLTLYKALYMEKQHYLFHPIIYQNKEKQTLSSKLYYCTVFSYHLHAINLVFFQGLLETRTTDLPQEIVDTNNPDHFANFFIN